MNLFYENMGPFLIAAPGCSAIFCTVVVAPDVPSSGSSGITEFGMQTGVTAMGLLLLRIVDPLCRTGTALDQTDDYEPFLWRVITASSHLIVTVWGPWPTTFSA